MPASIPQFRAVQRSPHWQALTCPSTLLLLLVLGSLLLSTRWLAFNIQPSAPYGLYRKRALPTTLERGMLVLLPPPPVMRPWHPWWLDLLKPIAGLPGDEICILDGGLWIRDEPYGAVLTEAYGTALPRMRGCFVVEDAHVFLATKTVRTLDSRYFGTVALGALTARAEPLWTWR